MSTLRKFFNMKIFPAKISYNENFPIYGTTRVVIPEVPYSYSITAGKI